MSETEEAKETTKPTAKASGAVQLNGLFLFKMGMSSVYSEAGEFIPVTVLKYEPLVISQIKTKESDGYEAVQVAGVPKKASRTTEAEKNHFKKSGFENGAKLIKEIRQSLPEGATVGQKIDIASLAKGDRVCVTARTKGRGFAGVHKRWKLGGGPESHGSGFHRIPGSVGNRTEPGRVMPGKKFPGHYGDETVSVKNLTVIDVVPEENAVLISGAIPGARNTLVQVMKA